MSQKKKIIFVIIRDHEGNERPQPYRVNTENIEGDLRSLSEQLDPGDEVARYHEVSDNYFFRHIMSLSHLGEGEACSDAMGELEELVYLLAPIVRQLKCVQA